VRFEKLTINEALKLLHSLEAAKLAPDGIHFVKVNGTVYRIKSVKDVKITVEVKGEIEPLREGG